MSGLNEKVTEVFSTLETMGDSVLALESTVFEVWEKTDTFEASVSKEVDTSNESDDVFFKVICRHAGQKDMLPSEAELLHAL